MIELKSAQEIKIMREGGKRLARILKALKKEVRPGLETRVLDLRARELCREEGVEPAFLGYKPHGARRRFPAALCVSVNDGVVHGTPGDRVLREGDLVKLDMGLRYKSFYVDSAVTVGVGKVSDEARALIHAAESALARGISVAKPGNTLGDVGFEILKEVSKKGFSIAKGLIGHGIGRELHEDPSVPNEGRRGEGEELRPGMVIAIEPMIAAGRGEIKALPDESYATRDGSLAAHAEHTVAITSRGPRVLT